MSNEKPFFTGRDFVNFNAKVIPGDKDSLDCIADIANEKLKGCSRGRKACDYVIEDLQRERDRLRAALCSIGHWCGMSPYHLGESYPELLKQVEYVRNYAGNALGGK